VRFIASSDYGHIMITAFDDFPIHAGSLPVNETGSSDPNHYDRYFFNGYRSDASLYFAAALGLYPNRHIADASFSVIVEGREQISLHASRRAPVDRAEANDVGPIKVIVLEPLRRHQIWWTVPNMVSEQISPSLLEADQFKSHTF
jgi:hypothetical protein